MKCNQCGHRYSCELPGYPGGVTPPGRSLWAGAVFALLAATFYFLHWFAFVSLLFAFAALLFAWKTFEDWTDCRRNNTCPACRTHQTAWPWSL